MQPPLLAALLAQQGLKLAFNMPEVGALPLADDTPPFHALLDVFPASRIAALELDPKLSEALNREASPGLRYCDGHTGR